jgi:replicative DNA helicase
VASADPAAVPPKNEEAERAVLGSALLDRDVIARISERLAPRDFYVDKHAVIYQTMLDVAARGDVDYLSVMDALDRSGRLAEAGGLGYLAELPLAVPTPIHAERYAGFVADCAIMRRLISAGGRIAQIGFQNTENPEVALARCEQLLGEVVGTGLASPVRPIVDALSDYLDQLRTLAEVDLATSAVATYRLPTTYRDLDQLLGGGFSRGDLVLLAGRPGMGKSSLGVEFLTRIASAWQVRAVLFSLEMGNPQVLGRMLSTGSGIPLVRFDDGRLTPSQREPFSRTSDRLAETPILLDDSARLPIATLRSRVRRLASEREGLDLVIVDHVQLLTGSGGSQNRVAEIGEISRSLKALAREHNVVVIALAQLSRAVEQRTDKVPQLSDLRESGTLEQDADVVLMLYREEYYKPDGERKGLADVYVAKHRNGRTGKITLVWNAETTGFTGMEVYGL